MKIYTRAPATFRQAIDTALITLTSYGLTQVTPEFHHKFIIERGGARVAGDCLLHNGLDFWLLRESRIVTGGPISEVESLEMVRE